MIAVYLNLTLLEKILGIDKGSCAGKTIVMIEVTDVEIINLRVREVM